MMIKREKYLSRLRDFRDDGAVKVITGVRGAGKTFLIKMFIDELRQTGIGDDQIIQLNFEDPEPSQIRDAAALHHYVQHHQNKTKKNYLFLDEIQRVNNWEKAINSFHANMNADIYLVVSNADLPIGKYDKLQVFPHSFKEYYDFQNGSADNIASLFNQYRNNGGFPAIATTANQELRANLKQGIFDSIVLRDIILHAHTRDDQAIMAIIEYLLNKLGSAVSATNIASILHQHGFKTTTSTAISYLNLLTKSFLFYRVPLYDVRNRRMLTTPSKYYVADSGFLNNENYQIKNIVCTELLQRGYSVASGDYVGKKIDFVAHKGAAMRYYQVVEKMSDDLHEVNSLCIIPDGYPKEVLTLTPSDVEVIDGIPIRYLPDWLLDRKN